MEIKLKTPISEGDIIDLTVGDVVYISGTIFTARDRAHQRIIENGAPYDLKGSVIFHAGPIIRMDDPKEHESSDSNIVGYESSETTESTSEAALATMVAVGPTTSTRMNPFQAQVIDKGVKVVIGKGGMDQNTSEALVRNKAVYLAAVGGCAALYVNSIKTIKNFYWLDLGVPEAIWELEVENFGPLVVAMDSKGANLYDEVATSRASSRGNGKNKS